MNKLKNLSLGLIIIIMFIGCNLDPFWSSAIYEKPKVEDLVGVYRLNSQNIDTTLTYWEYPETGRTVVPRIELLEDGTYTFEHLPIFTGDYRQPVFEQYYSKTGQWKIVRRQESFWDIEFEDCQYSGIIDLLGPEPPYRINFVFNVEAPKYVMYKKQNSSKAPQ